jgi:hypothetical protein
MKSRTLLLIVSLLLLLPLYSYPASTFPQASANAILKQWRVETKTPLPTPEVLLTAQYFIRNVMAENQQYVITNSSQFWNAVRGRYGGRFAGQKDSCLKHLYDFDWLVVHELEKHEALSIENFKPFFSDYLSILDIFCRPLTDSTRIAFFFGTYYSDWLVMATYQHDDLPKFKPVFYQEISDLPKNLSGLRPVFDSLETVLEHSVSNSKKIMQLISQTNKTILEKYAVYLTVNFTSGDKPAALINAFGILDRFQYPVKIGRDTIAMDIYKLRCIDNLTLGIAVAGYYYNKTVCLFPENELSAVPIFKSYFSRNKRFPFLEYFFPLKTIESLWEQGAITLNGYRELKSYYQWLNDKNGNEFITQIERLSNSTKEASSKNREADVAKSTLLHEAVGHGGTYANGAVKSQDLPTFEHHVEAEFYAYLLEFLYSPMQGFDMTCMFSRMANPITFYDQYGTAFLRICKELLLCIEKDPNLSRRYCSLHGRNGDIFKQALKSIDDFETLGFVERVRTVLLPMVSFLNCLTIDERRRLMASVYQRNTSKPIPEPGDGLLH